MLLFISGRHYVGGDYVKYLYWFEYSKLFPPEGFSSLLGLNYITIFAQTLSLKYFLFGLTDNDFSKFDGELKFNLLFLQ